MKKLFLSILTITLLFSCEQTDENHTIQIATAANMQFAMDSIARAFYEKHTINCEISSNSSGMLTAQIQNGAPYDIFISANMQYPEKLRKDGLAETSIIYALGRLVFVYPKEKHYSTIEEALNTNEIQRIAVADAKTAPYGIAATEFLKNTNYLEKLEKKIIFGESISQVNQYLLSKAVEGGFTSMSFVKKYSDDFNYIEVGQCFFKPIKQGACILKSGTKKKRKESELFISFLTSKECVEILQHFGYLVE